MNKDNEKEYISLEYNTPEGRLYSDLYSMQLDLDFSLDAINRSLEHLSSKQEADRDSNLLIHYLNSCLSSYCRCFNSGVRTSLDPSKVFNDEEYNKAHTYLSTYRSKHVIHSVNNFEQSKCAIVVSDRDPSKANVLGVSCAIMKLQYPADLEYQLNWLKRLICKCHTFIKTELEILGKKICKSAQENIKDICNNPELVLITPDLADVRKQRCNKR